MRSLRGLPRPTHLPAPADSLLRAPAPGEPLAAPLREHFEPLFSADFSAVRVHTDRDAAASASAAGARAFSQGRDIVFAPGQYQPHTAVGHELMAHELAHVVQQSRGGTETGAETRADAAATEVTLGRAVKPETVGGSPHGVQAKPDENADAATDTGLKWAPTPLDKFPLNSATLSSTHLANINTLVGGVAMHLSIRRNATATISVVGHTDLSGDEKTNQSLGQRRADAVKQALLDALTKAGIAGKVGEIASTSMGESSPVVPTADGVRNEKNRRVEVSVQIGTQTLPPAPPKFDPFAPLPPSALPTVPPDRELWQRMENLQKRIDELDRKYPRTNKSLSQAVIDKVMEGIDPIIDKLPVSKELRDLARSGLRKGLEKGSEAACDAVIDGTGATGTDAQAAKAACKAALKTPLGK